MAFWRQLIKRLSYRRLIDPIEIRQPLVIGDIKATVEIEAQATINANLPNAIKVGTIGIIVVEEEPERLYLNIQNIGMHPCLIALGDEASSDSFHFVLAADSGKKQGNGGALELREWRGPIVAICEEGETLLAVTELIK